MTLAAESTMHPDDPQLIKIGEITLKFELPQARHH